MINHDELISLLSYDKDTGLFLWNKSRGPKSKSGFAGHVSANGYVQIRLLGKLYYAHRLAWFFVHGKWPENHVDHINGNRSDNRIENLRDIIQQHNTQNQRCASKSNKLGLLGVYLDRGKYRSRIEVGGQTYDLGRHDTAESAHAAYIDAKRQHHQGCTL